MHTKRQVAVPLVAAVGLVVRGCAGEPATNLRPTWPMVQGKRSLRTHLSISAMMTTLNGERPDGELLPLQGVDIMLDTIDADGTRLLVERGVRKAGTRASIHVHQYGGLTVCYRGHHHRLCGGNGAHVVPDRHVLEHAARQTHGRWPTSALKRPFLLTHSSCRHTPIPSLSSSLATPVGPAGRMEN